MSTPTQKKDRPHLVRVEEDVDTFLREEAAHRRISVSQVIRDAIYEFMRARREGRQK